ncbi:Cytochrome c4 [Thioalkalivibrio nitratireducens DSM 14787]|uniref:Cytochrome c4 n=1 Tax=Thioalkalivibrio nitratireducens (strain DSM 14787 / UNIQEM 213 / ALEN2) TaxID=1255043 RepID=L0E271_THIND|nr:c-type cytochrome [Thioalkalivibrio nitratireducens]AGA35373.1 Cytochrome c4 [Thioalkalivibrio nitratireducens DSM 14787]
MNYMRASLPMILSLALLLPLSAQAGDPARGQELSQACAACHGADGNSANPEWPKLAGQHADYIHKQLMDYKTGRREDALMAGQVANLDEQDMRDLGAFYARLEMSTATADETVAERGERIYRGGIPSAGVAACIACHGATGKGNPAAMFPRVAGQHAQYNADQLHDFRSGQRANDNGRMMRNVAARMSDDDIRAVSEYMAGLRAR